MNVTQSVKSICSLINNIPGTLISGVWFWISYAFLNYWYVIAPAITIWVVIEILTRNTHSFNSNNGFTPAFNSFVGGGVFLGFESIIHFFLNIFFGGAMECWILWFKLFYLVPFIATGLFLNVIGFWYYMRLPILKVKIDIFGRGRMR